MLLTVILQRASLAKTPGLRTTTCLSRSLHGTHYKVQSNVTGEKVNNKHLYCLQLQRHFFWERKSRDYYYKKDGVAEDYTIVYQGPAKGYVEAGRLAALSCPICLTLLGVNYTFDLPLNISSMEPFLESTTEAYVILSMYVGLSLAVAAVVNRFVLRLYYKDSSKDFIAVLPAWGLKTTRLLPFKAGEAAVVADRDILNIGELKGHIKIKNNRVIILQSNFQTPLYYNLMLGYGDNQGDNSEKPPSE